MCSTKPGTSHTPLEISCVIPPIDLFPLGMARSLAQPDTARVRCRVSRVWRRNVRHFRSVDTWGSQIALLRKGGLKHGVSIRIRDVYGRDAILRSSLPLPFSCFASLGLKNFSLRLAAKDEPGVGNTESETHGRLARSPWQARDGPRCCIAKHDELVHIRRETTRQYGASVLLTSGVETIYRSR